MADGEQVFDTFGEYVAPDDVACWSVEDVANWVLSTGFPHYMDCFRGNGFNGSRLLMLTMDTLPRIGITQFDDMKAIMRSLRALRGVPPDIPETLQDYLNSVYILTPRPAPFSIRAALPSQAKRFKQKRPVW